MRYEYFNELYNQIYGLMFVPIKYTDFEYCYLEEEHYVLRKIGSVEFVIIRARSPIQALDNLMKIKE